MLRRWSSRLSATLRADGAAVRLMQRDRRGRWQQVAAAESRGDAAPAGLTDVVAVLDAVLRDLVAGRPALRGARCDVTVEDCWTVYELIEGDLHEQPRRAADELACAVLADTAMLDPAALAVRWQGQGAGRTLAGALPAEALQALAAALHRHGLRLGRVQGEFVTRFNEARFERVPEPAVLALRHARGTQLALLVDGRLAAVSYEPGVHSAEGVVERGRALLRAAGHEPGERTRFVGGADDAAWESTRPAAARGVAAMFASLRGPALDLDFSPARRAVGARSWALLGVGALAFVFAGLQYQSISGEHRRESQRLQAVEAALGEIDAAPAVKPSADEARRQRKATAVARELQVPWARLFAAIEGVDNRNVALLAVEPSPQRREVRIVAEAKTSKDMFDFLDALQTQPLADVALVSHQVQAQSPGSPIRFQARALWSTP